MSQIYTAITEKPIDILKAIDSVKNPSFGAIDTFIGTVRNQHDGKMVKGITYDIHTSLAEQFLKRLCYSAHSIWPETNYYVEHYKGELLVGGISIIIAVSASHRVECFDACRYVIEEIKKGAPVWKKEHYEDGSRDWLPGYSLIEAETFKRNGDK